MEHSNCQQIKRITLLYLALAPMFFQTLWGLAPGDRTIGKNTVKTVVIDAGHGGKDPGALGKHIKEKDVVLAIALKTGAYIRNAYPDVKVIYTRETDVFLPLHERAEIANKNKADLFISIHANSLPNSPAYGTETFVMGDHKTQSNFEVAKLENSVITLEEDFSTKYEGFDPNSHDSYIIFSLMQSIHKNQSLKYASLVQDEFREKAKRIDRGVKQAGFLVLWKTSMPSVLVEVGFLTHSDEERYLGSDLGQDHLASSIFRAFRKYKEYIESNSHFETTAPQATDTGKQNNNVHTGQASVHSDPRPYFKVQLMTSRTSYSENDAVFKKYQHPETFKTGDWYKLAVGKSYSYQEIKNYCREIKKEYPDAFVIAVKNGELVPLKAAIEENKE